MLIVRQGQLIATLIVLLIAGCTISQPGVSSSFLNQRMPEKLAVLAQEDHTTPGLRRIMEDRFISGLLSKGYAVASRSDMDIILREIQFQRSGLTDADAARIGKMLNVPAVLVVSVTNLQKRYHGGTYSTTASMSARLVSVETAEILWVNSASHSPSMGDLLGGMLGGAGSGGSSGLGKLARQAEDVMGARTGSLLQETLPEGDEGTVVAYLSDQLVSSFPPAS